MKPVPIHTAKTELSRLIERGCAAEDVAPERNFGVYRGKLVVDASCFEPLNDDELARWE